MTKYKSLIFDKDMSGRIVTKIESLIFLHKFKKKFPSTKKFGWGRGQDITTMVSWPSPNPNPMGWRYLGCGTTKSSSPGQAALGESCLGYMINWYIRKKIYQWQLFRRDFTHQKQNRNHNSFCLPCINMKEKKMQVNLFALLWVCEFYQ